MSDSLFQPDFDSMIPKNCEACGDPQVKYRDGWICLRCISRHNIDALGGPHRASDDFDGAYE
jgi:hypothetical protein